MTTDERATKYGHLEPEMVRLYTEENLDPVTVARRLGVPVDPVYTVLREAGVVRRQRRTTEKRARNQAIVERHEAGESLAELADEYNVSKSRINQIVKTAKIAAGRQERARLASAAIRTTEEAEAWLHDRLRHWPAHRFRPPTMGRYVGSQTWEVSVYIETRGDDDTPAIDILLHATGASAVEAFEAAIARFEAFAWDVKRFQPIP